VVYNNRGRRILSETCDESLAGQAASGNMAAFEELVNRHRAGVYRLARSITGNHDDADDAAQETFLRVYRALGTFDPDRSFRAWLKKIAFNTSLNVLRSSRVRSRETAVRDVPDLADPAPGPDHDIAGNQTATGIQRAVSSMPAELRTTLLLRAVEGMSYQDIAIATGVRIGTVMSRLSRARGKVRQVLESSEVPGPEGEKT
jgi:RNA polymerase sigma factor (sigma-70 family)